MKLTKIEQSILDNWFLTNIELSKLNNTSSKYISKVRCQLRDKYNQTQRSYIDKNDLNYILHNINKSTKELYINLKCRVQLGTINYYKKCIQYNKTNNFINTGYKKIWSLDELLFLKENKCNNKLLYSKLNRSPASIHLKKYTMNNSIFGNKTTDKITNNIKKELKTKTINEISKKLKISKPIINNVIYKYNIQPIKKNNIQNKYTDKEIKFIVNNYKVISHKDIAKKLNRTYLGINWKIKQLIKQNIIKKI